MADKATWHSANVDVGAEAVGVACTTPRACTEPQPTLPPSLLRTDMGVATARKRSRSTQRSPSPSLRSDGAVQELTTVAAAVLPRDSSAAAAPLSRVRFRAPFVHRVGGHGEGADDVSTRSSTTPRSADAPRATTGPARHTPQASASTTFVNTLFATAAGVPVRVSEMAMQQARMRFSQDDESYGRCTDSATDDVTAQTCRATTTRDAPPCPTNCPAAAAASSSVVVTTAAHTTRTTMTAPSLVDVTDTTPTLAPSRTESPPLAATAMVATMSTSMMRGTLGNGSRRRGFVPPMQRATALQPFTTPSTMAGSSFTATPAPRPVRGSDTLLRAPTCVVYPSPAPSLLASSPCSTTRVLSQRSHTFVRLRFDFVSFASTWPRAAPPTMMPPMPPRDDVSASSSMACAPLCCGPLLRALLNLSTTDTCITTRHWHHMLLRLGAAATHCTVEWCDAAVGVAVARLRLLVAAARTVDGDRCQTASGDGRGKRHDDVAQAAFTPTSVALHLCAMYNREVVDGVRSALRQVLEGDVPAASLMVLQVTEVCDERVAPHTRVVRVCDGAYQVKVSLDVPLSNLLREGVLGAGKRIAVCGAKKLVSSQQSLFECLSRCVLALNYNCVRAVDACTPMGLCYAEPAPLPLHLVHPLGGLVPAICGTVVRVLPAFFVTQAALVTPRQHASSSPSSLPLSPRQANTMSAAYVSRTSRSHTRKCIRNAYAYRQYAVSASAMVSKACGAVTAAPGVCRALGGDMDDGHRASADDKVAGARASEMRAGCGVDGGQDLRSGAGAEELTRVVSILLRSDDGAEALVQQWRAEVPRYGEDGAVVDVDDAATASASEATDELPVEGSEVIVYALNPSRSQTATAPFAHAKLFYSSRNLHFVLRAAPPVAPRCRAVCEAFAPSPTTPLLRMGAAVDFAGVYLGVRQSMHGAVLLFALRDDTYALLQVPLPSDARMLVLPIPASHGVVVLVLDGTFLTYADPAAGSDCVRIVANEYTTLTQNPTRPYLRSILAGMSDVVDAVGTHARKYASRRDEIFRCVCGELASDMHNTPNSLANTASTTSVTPATAPMGATSTATHATAAATATMSLPSSSSSSSATVDSARSSALRGTAANTVMDAAHTPPIVYTNTARDADQHARSTSAVACCGAEPLASIESRTALTTTSTTDTTSSSDCNDPAGAMSLCDVHVPCDSHSHNSNQLLRAAIDCHEALCMTRTAVAATTANVAHEDALTAAPSSDTRLPYYLRSSAPPRDVMSSTAQLHRGALPARTTLEHVCAPMARAAHTSACHERSLGVPRTVAPPPPRSPNAVAASDAHAVSTAAHTVAGAATVADAAALANKGDSNNSNSRGGGGDCVDSVCDNTCYLSTCARTEIATLRSGTVRAPGVLRVVYACVTDMTVHRVWPGGRCGCYDIPVASIGETPDPVTSARTDGAPAVPCHACIDGCRMLGTGARTRLTGCEDAFRATAAAVLSPNAVSAAPLSAKHACALTCTLVLRRCRYDADANDIADSTSMCVTVRDAAVLESMLGAVASVCELRIMARGGDEGGADARLTVTTVATAKHESALQVSATTAAAHAVSDDSTAHAWWQVLSSVGVHARPDFASDDARAHDAPQVRAHDVEQTDSVATFCLRALARSLSHAVFRLVVDDSDEVRDVHLVAASTLRNART